MLLSRVAEALGLDYRGEDRDVSGVNSLEAAGPADLAHLADPRYAHLLASTQAGAVLLPRDQAGAAPRALLSSNVPLDWARAVALFAKPQGCLAGISDQAFIHPEAEVDPSAAVYPFAFVGARARIKAGVSVFPQAYVGEDCEVAEGCILYPGAVLMAGTRLGRGVVLHPGAVLGADGFGYVATPTGPFKIPQVGRVVIEDGVEVGANSCVDRAALTETRVGAGTKIDNLVQIAHNVRVGRACFLVSQVGVAGSTTLGDGVILAGQVGVVDHVKIGDRVTIGAQSGVSKDLPDGFRGAGSPVMEQGQFLRQSVISRNLPDLAKKLKLLEKEVERLKSLLPPGDAHER